MKKAFVMTLENIPPQAQERLGMVFLTSLLQSISAAPYSLYVFFFSMSLSFVREQILSYWVIIFKSRNITVKCLIFKENYFRKSYPQAPSH